MNVLRFAIFGGTVMHAIVFVESLNDFQVGKANSLETKKLGKLGVGGSGFL